MGECAKIIGRSNEKQVNGCVCLHTGSFNTPNGVYKNFLRSSIYFTALEWGEMARLNVPASLGKIKNICVFVAPNTSYENLAFFLTKPGVEVMQILPSTTPTRAYYLKFELVNRDIVVYGKTTASSADSYYTNGAGIIVECEGTT